MKNQKSFELLVTQIKPVQEDKQGKLMGGFSQSSVKGFPPVEINGKCSTNDGCTVNTVAGCGA